MRAYTERPIEGEVLERLLASVTAANAESGLHIQLVRDDGEPFGGLIPKYGKFVNARNYLALVGKDDANLAEKCGYYGQKLVLIAQTLGLNTCWVAGTYSKRKVQAEIDAGEKLLLVIALGYGQTEGAPHKSKPIEALCKVSGEMPDWFRRGMEAAQKAPTAMNQQKFRFTLNADGSVTASSGGSWGKINLGIVKCNFELGAGKDGWRWAE
ncbi:MAG: nitroreductase [Firmicutes bacterium]|nr:nitroreductase [Bacillota bacterium]